MINIEKLRKDLEVIIRDEPKYETYDATVDQVLRFLADEGMGFADEDAELPKENPNEDGESLYNAKYTMFGDICEDAQQDMLGASFKKFIPLKDLNGEVIKD